MKSFSDKLQNYANILVSHGLNIQPEQILNISTEAIHKDFALIVARAAYERGAKYVNIDLSTPELARARLLQSAEHPSREDNLNYVPKYLEVKYRELVDESAANLKIIGSENPDILADLEPRLVNKTRLSLHKAIKYFYDEGIGKSLVHWTVAAASTPGWAKNIFPELSAEEGHSRLWEEIFKICRADKKEGLSIWKEHNDALHKRANALNGLKLKELHFTGPETDLRIFLSTAARFRGGTDQGPRGVPFEPNIPTEEVFTTPDCRKTTGHVKTTRPFLINGVLVKDLHLEFIDGKINQFSASSGEDTFREYIKSDDASNMLGEVALVGIDSPVYQSGLIFQEILFDENAACHIAVGSAYKFCLEGGENMSKEALAAIGCNDSTVHTDMMISSEKVDVTGTPYDGEAIPLIRNGSWVFSA